MRQRWLVAALGAVSMGVIAIACNSSSNSGGASTTSYSYGTTSTKGDYSEWTTNGDILSVTWKMVSSTGLINKTLMINSLCGAADATYGFKSCSVTSASCTNGALTCGGSDAPAIGTLFYSFEVPGTALFVKAQDGSGAEQLHVGFSLNTTCPTASGTTTDHTFLHLGLAQQDVFGVYRATPTFSTIQHADFYMATSSCNGATNTGNCTATPTIGYSTGGGTGTGVETVSNYACANGVSSFDIGSNHLRAVKANSGVFILDLPAGSGGLVAFPTSLAATTADFANRNFGGIVFPDDGSGTQLINLTTGALASSAVTVTSLSVHGSGLGDLFTNTNIHAANSVSGLSSPGYPNFTNAVSAFTSNNTLSSTYATPSAIPGLFVFDGTAAGDNGRVMVMAMKSGDRILAFGSVYNWRNNQYGYSGHGYVNSGAFILFSK